MNINLKTIFAFTVLLGSYYSPVDAHGEHKGRGLHPATHETLKDVEANWHFVIGANPNKVGAERIRTHLGLEAAESEEVDELVTVQGKPDMSGIAAGGPLPESVDNSELPSFPPIGDQGQLGSCVAFGSTYYQGTHEYGLVNGINNKSPSNSIFSPKWTYNLLNKGVDGGLDIFSTYQLFAQSGYGSLATFPYDTNYRAWDLHPQDWITALNSRTNPAHLVAGIGGSTQNLQAIKQLLNNGHVLTFGTYVDSWVFAYVQADPSEENNPHAGELAAAWMNGYNGGHCMTIVGYDDNIWIDINNNGEVDEGEKGAFLIANSWGAEWGNAGFVWVAYDAFLAQSAVANGPNQGRVPLGDALNSNVVTVVPLAQAYTPKLIAQFSLTQSERDQIAIWVGISGTETTTPVKTIQSFPLLHQGGNYRFDGTAPKSNQTATFAMDLSDLISAVNEPMQRFYLIVGDNQKGRPTTLQSFTLIDNVNNKQVNCTHTPLVCDNNRKSVYIDYDIANGSLPQSAPPQLSVTSPAPNQTVRNYFWVVAKASDAQGIDRVEFYIDSNLHSTHKTSPYQALIQTGHLSAGDHQITVIAYNTGGTSSTQTIPIQVSR